MGAWGFGSFQNDDAMDWVGDLERNGPRAIVGALSKIHSGAEHLEAPGCSKAIAAAEVVAAIKGKPATSLPPKVQAYLDGKPSADGALIGRAREAIELIQVSSELQQLWEESGEYDKWKAIVADIENRLY